MDRTKYVAEVNRQLSDHNTYELLTGDPFFRITEKILKIVDHFATLGVFDNNMYTFLINQTPITPVFYVLPKVHKTLIDPPGRPIVASVGSILSPLAIVLEKILTPLIRDIPSFLADTQHFLNTIAQLGPVPPDSLLVTIDVDSLYTSIEHSGGIQAVKSFLERSNYSIIEREFFIQLLHLVLYENYFMFEDSYYLQKRGTAMGSNVAPPYANAYMSKFEDEFVYDTE